VTPPPEALAGRALREVGRRGKFLVFDFAGPRILVHLSQGGRVQLEAGREAARPRGGVVRLRFDRPPAVLVREYGTERKAGWWVLEAREEGPLARLGPEPFSEEFAALIREAAHRGHLHGLLRDQRRVAGIGRGYADDILHRARLSPFRSLSSLDPGERERLLVAVREVLGKALEAERGRTGGLPARLGDHFAVHSRFGQPCPRCGADLRRVWYESHEVTYCPACQTGGRVLADRRLSRLLR
jgi:formamidopyrimidine-DNA glycosylase